MKSPGSRLFILYANEASLLLGDTFSWQEVASSPQEEADQEIQYRLGQDCQSLYESNFPSVQQTQQYH